MFILVYLNKAHCKEGDSRVLYSFCNAMGPNATSTRQVEIISVAWRRSTYLQPKGNISDALYLEKKGIASEYVREDRVMMLFPSSRTLMKPSHE